MTDSRFFNFARLHPAVLVAGVLVIVFVFGLAGALRPRRATTGTPLFTNSTPGEITTLVRDSASLPGPAAKPMAATPVPIVTSSKPLVGVNIHVAVPPITNPPTLDVYAPAGRLLRCQLVNTVDSANIDTPIVALVTDDLWHDGRLVIPSGTEVHGKASVERMRDRIVASGAWTLVWQSGHELVVNGIALDRDASSSGTAWGITDGSAGLRGQILRSDSLAEIKLFAATFMSGVASGLQEERSTILGTQVANTARNATLDGASQVMNTYAQQMLEAIRRDGIFVRVPAGTLMYLYITQTIDRSFAKSGNLRVTAMPNAAFTSITKP